MRVVVDLDLCQGHGNCVEEAPEVFALDPGGRVRVLQPEPAEERRGEVANALRYCPTGAISIVE